MRERSDLIGVVDSVDEKYLAENGFERALFDTIILYEIEPGARVRGKDERLSTSQIRCASLVSRARIKPGFYGRAEPSAASERAECGDSDIGVIYTPLFLADVTSMRRNSSIVVAKTRSRSYE